MARDPAGHPVARLPAALLDALEVEELVVDRERWALLVAIDGRRTVRELVRARNRPVLDVCHALLELVDAGAVGVIDPAAARAPEPTPGTGARTPAGRAGVARAAAAEPGRRAGPSRRAPRSLRPAEVDRVARSRRRGAGRRACTEPPPAAVLTIVPEADAEPAGRSEPQPEPDARPSPSRWPRPVGATPDKGAFLRLFSGLRES